MHENYLALLRLAQRIRLNANAPDTLTDIITSGEATLQSLRARAGGKIWPTRRPQTKGTTPQDKCTVFVDECGAHCLETKNEFGAFVVAAVIVRDTEYPKLNKQWKRWKHNNLGSAGKVIHEPDVRWGRGPFYFNKDTTRRLQVTQSLGELITRLDFAAIACVVDRQEYVAQFGLKGLDDSLPTDPYLMALDFLMERLVIVLEQQFNGARARIVAEARGPREDALLQYEYVRLQLDGTSYISASWFRQQLAAAIEFKTKKDNCSGIQLADLLARPCGEKILAPTTSPVRWPEFRQKLCLGQETTHSILGLKVTPWHERYTDVWKS